MTRSSEKSTKEIDYDHDYDYDYEYNFGRIGIDLDGGQVEGQISLIRVWINFWSQ